jgi:predicted enzyme related to lactoylglutathione lyase
MLDNFDYNLVDVKSIDETAAEIKCGGGFMLNPKDAIPGLSYMDMFKSAEGTLFGVVERDAATH